MQEIPERFEFRAKPQYGEGLGEEIFLAQHNGDGYRVTWGTTNQVDYTNDLVRSFLVKGTWVIQNANPREIDSLPERGGIKLGDRVKVTNPGKTYSTYMAWARLHGLLASYHYEYTPDKFAEGTVVSIGPHYMDRKADLGVRFIFAVKLDDGPTVLMGEGGIAPVVESNTLATTLDELRSVLDQIGTLARLAETLREKVLKEFS